MFVKFHASGKAAKDKMFCAFLDLFLKSPDEGYSCLCTVSFHGREG
jgi:hypothetical protein